jgi:hypothetical protein
MSQKFKNRRQKAQWNSQSISKLFNALLLNFCHNPTASAEAESEGWKGCC